MNAGHPHAILPQRAAEIRRPVRIDTGKAHGSRPSATRLKGRTMLHPRISSGLLVAVSMLAACGERASDAPRDKYDPAQMEFRSPPARVTSERHTGAFSSGPSLNPGAQLNSLDPSQVKDVRLDTTHKVIEIAPGLKYSAWTFGDQVPGPAIRARVGDRIRFTMTNRSDEPVPALRVTDAPMMHSMDFHSAMVSPQDKYRSIAPGQTITFEFTLNYPGVFM
jgi:nitrite reductase (NO-forming)